MTVRAPPPGTLGNLTPDEQEKLQQAWIHLLRLCGSKSLEGVSFSEPVPDLTHELRQQMSDKSPDTFREGLWGFILSEHPDALVLRFLRARKWDVEKAMVMLVSAVNWRLERDLAETIIHKGESVGLKKAPSADDQGFISQYRSGKSFVHSVDKESRLVYIIRVREHDPNAQSGDSMETYILHNIESLKMLMKPPDDKCCLIFDMTGFGLKNMDFHVVKFLVSVFEARYPETLGVILIHNAPFVFWGLWNMIKGWLDPVIASKINFTRKSADLLQFVPAENLQTSYGGKDSFEYKYIEPVEGENAKLEEVEKRAEIQHERNELVDEFELRTSEWASLAADTSAEKEKASRRTETAEHLSKNYWTLDPYIRARTVFHRLGMVG
ncbi:CRAL/TRIO domain-containing protein [Xylaria bambusicola]|uniref:CRAL/TRIO domain-containing protein n=1 Tax=Xylaria bambusicola TaxID=326684 RepID=UPI002007CFCB|nr:CRAL/TRIO domain-containing protein [Xylaria bambusicola]KAI0521075.1 CRAL/TRIO domain-containing protein [Xylaria bambusicola]